MISDNGPQFASELYANFAKEYEFQHVTSSPNYPQGNGEAERGVQTIKNLLKKSGDPYLALMAYRSTPLEVGYSPSELLMSRKLRTTLPMTAEQRMPKTPDFSVVTTRDKKVKERQKKNFDAHRGARELPILSPGECVWVPDRQASGRVVEETSPRSYVVQTPDGEFRRNRRHLISTPEQDTETSTEESISTPPQNENSQTRTNADDTGGQGPTTTKEYHTRSRSSRTPKPPDRLDTSWTKNPKERGM